jgi:hypothetical protein
MIGAARLLAVGSVLITLAGCGSATGTEATPPLEGASIRPAVHPVTIGTTALLTDIRAARHPGFDRLVFVFSNVVPGYDVRYVERPVRADGSGAVVRVAGAFVAQVRLEPALDADLSKPSVPLTYAGPRRFVPSAAVVKEVVRIGGFEGVLTWAVGTDRRAPFRVLTLEGPPRLVLDVATG